MPPTELMLYAVVYKNICVIKNERLWIKSLRQSHLHKQQSTFWISSKYHLYCLISVPVTHLPMLVSKIIILPGRCKMHNQNYIAPLFCLCIILNHSFPAQWLNRVFVCELPCKFTGLLSISLHVWGNFLETEE